MDLSDLEPLARSFVRHLKVANRSDRTVGNYVDSIRQLAAFLRGRGLTLTDATRDDVDASCVDQLELTAPTQRRPGTSTYHRMRPVHGLHEPRRQGNRRSGR
jgi:hypothetical protein